MPRVPTAAATSGLLFGDKDAALGRPGRSGFHGDGVGGANLVKVMNVRGKDGPVHQGCEDFREKQVGHRAELVAGGGAPFYRDSERTELLDEAPDFGARDAEVAGEFGPAHDHSGVVHQQSNNPGQAGVGEMGGRGGRLARASWSLRSDEGIMREEGGKNNPAGPACEISSRFSSASRRFSVHCRGKENCDAR